MNNLFKLGKKTVICAMLAIWAIPASASTITSVGSGAQYVDKFSGTSHTLSFSDVGTITDVTVSVKLGGSSIQFGDLDMFLVHEGVSVQLLAANSPVDCCSGLAPFDVVFDDDATQTVGGSDTVGLFKPQNGSLAAFDGLSVTGTWELQIFEVICCENETDLVAWSVTATVQPVPLAATMPFLFAGLGAFGLTAYRRKT